MEGIRTEPIARKKEKVAALLSIYCERVARNPRGPEPFLCCCFVRENEGETKVVFIPEDAV